MTNARKNDAKSLLKTIAALDTKQMKNHELRKIKQQLKSRDVKSYVRCEGQNFLLRTINKPFRQTLLARAEKNLDAAIARLRKNNAFNTAVTVAAKTFYKAQANGFNRQAAHQLKLSSQKTHSRLDQKTTGDRFTSQKRVSAKYQAPVQTKD